MSHPDRISFTRTLIFDLEVEELMDHFERSVERGETFVTLNAFVEWLIEYGPDDVPQDKEPAPIDKIEFGASYSMVTDTYGVAPGLGEKITALLLERFGSVA